MREVMTRLSNSRGFSLIELMISVAIIAVMSAIAFPTFQSLRAKAKESEMRMHLAAIRTCEETYKSENDVFYACPAHPAIIPTGGNRVPWDNPPPPVEWDTIGFSADSPVLYQYAIINVVAGTAYTATAEGDVDCDSQTAMWRITPQSNYRPVRDPATDDH
jgi:prepilin-type N-terminal cleavage/methylation domain-containing protein